MANIYLKIISKGKWTENRGPASERLPGWLVNLNIYYFSVLILLHLKAPIKDFLQDAHCLSKNLDISKAQVSSDTPVVSIATVKGANVIVFLMIIDIKGWVHSLSHNFLQIPRGIVVKYLRKGKLSWLVRRRSLGSCPAIKLLPQWGCMAGTPPCPCWSIGCVKGPDGQALGQDSGSDKGADMREKERRDNHSHLGEKAISDSTIAIT